MADNKEKVYWVPLESSPEAMNKMIHRIGVDKSVGFSDVLGLDDELLAMTPQPVYAVIFLFPTTDSYLDGRKQEAENSTANPRIWYSKQTIGNACGSMAILHALGNLQSQVSIEGSLKEFFEKTKEMSPMERTLELEKTKGIADAHAASAAEGQTAAPVADAQIDHHYAAFVRVDGRLYELDGVMPGPIDLGPSTDVLKDAAAAIQKRIAALGDSGSLVSVLSFGALP
ncbi:Ubiquitin carboxyl-terminal hydrolase isozyme L3 [Coemansia sp. RSA 2336]|nr:Ubiquitin carboxyl-terminal hydrolase isozyme L3 [Coemansia sp. RSA 2336]